MRVRIADKDFEFDGAPNVRGSVIVSRRDNAADSGDLAARVGMIAAECGVDVRAIGSGFGKGDLPDLGGGHFHLLERPRVAVLTRGGVSTGDFGTVWHLLEQTLAIRNSQISDEDTGFDLRRYNVIIIPSYQGDLKESFAKDIRAWVESGGTLIATGGASGIFTTEKSAIGSARRLPGALNEIEPFRQQVLREWLAAEGAILDGAQIWARDVATEVSYPWRTDDKDGPDTKELQRRDEWQRLFMPQGAILAGRVNTEHWLTAGAAAVLPIFTAVGPVLLAPSGVESPVRYGVFRPADDEDEEDEEAQPSFVGWSAMPPGRKLTLRMSGLLWPEAAQRLANSAYVTRESIGKGQVILFAGLPTFRAASLGTQRLMMNAIVAGPGIGASGAIIP
jgi:hypothetical protein